MIKEISFKFMPEYEEIEEGSSADDIDYFDHWGSLDISIDGESFFSNYNDPENKGPLGGSTISKKGIVGQLYTFLWSLSTLPQDLLVTDTVIVADDEIDKCLVFSLRNHVVTFAVCKNEFTFLPWKTAIYYDGEKISQSNEIPKNCKNMIEFQPFRQGLKNGLEKFVQEIIEKHPEIMIDNHFIELKERVERI